MRTGYLAEHEIGPPNARKCLRVFRLLQLEGGNPKMGQSASLAQAWFRPLGRRACVSEIDVTANIPDEYVPLLVTAWEHYAAYTRAVQREKRK
jgi:hypothetical protein